MLAAWATPKCPLTGEPIPEDCLRFLPGSCNCLTMARDHLAKLPPKGEDFITDLFTTLSCNLNFAVCKAPKNSILSRFLTIFHSGNTSIDSQKLLDYFFAMDKATGDKKKHFESGMTVSAFFKEGG